MIDKKNFASEMANQSDATAGLDWAPNVLSIAPLTRPLSLFKKRGDLWLDANWQQGIKLWQEGSVLYDNPKNNMMGVGRRVENLPDNKLLQTGILISELPPMPIWRLGYASGELTAKVGESLNRFLIEHGFPVSKKWQTMSSDSAFGYFAENRKGRVLYPSHSFGVGMDSHFYNYRAGAVYLVVYDNSKQMLYEGQMPVDLLQQPVRKDMDKLPKNDAIGNEIRGHKKNSLKNKKNQLGFSDLGDYQSANSLFTKLPEGLSYFAFGDAMTTIAVNGLKASGGVSKKLLPLFWRGDNQKLRGGELLPLYYMGVNFYVAVEDEASFYFYLPRSAAVSLLQHIIDNALSESAGMTRLLLWD